MADRQDPFGALFDLQGEAMREMFGGLGLGGMAPAGQDHPEWMAVAGKLQAMWAEFLAEKGASAGTMPNPLDPAQFMLMSQGWAKAAPFQPQALQGMVQESMALWQGVLGGIVGKETPEAAWQSATDGLFGACCVAVSLVLWRGRRRSAYGFTSGQRLGA